MSKFTDSELETLLQLYRTAGAKLPESSHHVYTRFVSMGLVDDSGALTEKGKLYVEGLHNVELPVQVWTHEAEKLDNAFAPIHIEVLIQSYCNADYIPSEAPSYRKAANRLQHLGLIDDNFCPTDKGSVYVKALCSVPLPVQKWVMP